MSETTGIFSKIVAGDIPCHRLHEDQHTLAFLDIGPISWGHCLLIPKRAYVELSDMPPDVAAALGSVMPRLCRAVRAATGCDGVNVLQNNGAAAGQEVMHVHFHFIPRYLGGDTAEGSGGGLEYEWKAGTLSDADAAELRRKITAALADG